MDVIQSQEETQPVSGFGTPGFIPLKLDKEEIDPRTYGEGTGLGNSSGGGGGPHSSGHRVGGGRRSKSVDEAAGGRQTEQVKIRTRHLEEGGVGVEQLEHSYKKED